MPAMTLNLSDKEMNRLDEFAKAKEMTKTAVIKRAIRLYDLMDGRLSKGEKVRFVELDGRETEVIFSGGCGWPGMD